ncbi:methyltransferase TYW3 domain-containing protein [Sarocladium implicatum]|nr:methyltransferase TYW3 domain-containing protein [Sarocladium implicatum]
MPSLPQPSAAFLSKKAKILDQLSVPDATYTDLSPKGSVDLGIRDLIAEVNAFDGLVTTSSCAGRISVFLEGIKREDGGRDGQVATPGGKGAGGQWLFVSHDPVNEGREEHENWSHVFGLSEEGEGDGRRLIHFKFEPMILHVHAASPLHAQLILRCAIMAGFRESGAINIVSSSPGESEKPTPMVGIRSMGLGFESLIGIQASGQRQQLVSPDYLIELVRIGNERFAENASRIERFRESLRKAMAGNTRIEDSGEGWEDAATRRERKRAEGLKKKAEKEAAGGHADQLDDEVSIPW